MGGYPKHIEDRLKSQKLKEKFLTVDQVSKRLNISKPQIYKMIENGTLKAVKFGTKRGYRISETVVNDFIKLKSEE